MATSEETSIQTENNAGAVQEQPDARGKVQPDAKAEVQPDAKAEVQPDGQAEVQPNAQRDDQKAKENEEPTPSGSCNPNFDEAGDVDLERLRGDAIGNTLFSERFVLSTLLKLSKLEKDISEDEAYQTDLCSVWDMTIDKDVVALLLKHHILELFAECIDATQDRRLTEILVGIMGNICNVQEGRMAVRDSADIMCSLLGLLSCTDALTLIQVMRLLRVVLMKTSTESATAWLIHFSCQPTLMHNFCFIFSNSNNEKLLSQSLGAFCAVVTQYVLIPIQMPGEAEEYGVEFCELSQLHAIIKSTFVAIKTYNEKMRKDIERDEDITLAYEATMRTFLEIHYILTLYGRDTQSRYAQHMEEILSCFHTILKPLCTTPYVLKLGIYQQEAIEVIGDICSALGNPFDEQCFGYMITIWNILINNMKPKVEEPENDFDKEDEDDEEDEEKKLAIQTKMCNNILDFIAHTVPQATEQQLQKTLKEQPTQTIQELVDVLNKEGTENPEKFHYCYYKIKMSFEQLNNAEKDTK